MIIVVRMNRLNSSVSAKNRKANCRQNLPRTRATPVIAETARITAVDPRSEPNRVTVFSEGVRSGTNHRIQLASSLPRPAGQQDVRQQQAEPDDRGAKHDERDRPHDHGGEQRAMRPDGVTDRAGHSAGVRGERVLMGRRCAHALLLGASACVPEFPASRRGKRFPCCTDRVACVLAPGRSRRGGV